MEDERHFNFYDIPLKRLPNQIALLEKLESLGYEQKGKFILTTESIGIPVTSILLLLKEALEFIINEQHEFDKNETDKIVANLSFTDLINEIPDLIIINSTNLPQSFYYEKQKVWDLNTTPSISGSVVAYQSYIYVTPKPLGNNFDVFNYNGSRVTIYKSIIHNHSDILNEKNMIQLYKNIIMFVELSYALQQRIIEEQRLFKNFTNNHIKKLQFGNNFKSVCGKRSGIIHGGSFKLKIVPETSKIVLSKDKDVVSVKFEKSFHEVIEWTNNIYGEMLKAL